ncbi:GNAT family N-acetyltransferase [Pseudomonas sp.]|uniref:GNAT family N-acetyltransferase n=1 Tax=Pseudomonas sp. TaxID=306 RepID=UPI003A980F32
MSLEIRPVSPADQAAWLPLWQGYQQFYGTEISAQTSATTWQRFLDPMEPMHAAIAWLDGKPVGVVHWIFHRSCWTVGDYCYLQDLFVEQQLRGAGVGRKLIEHVYAQATAAGASRVHWLTHESNTDAMQLYDRIADRPGFIQYRKLF